MPPLALLAAAHDEAVRGLPFPHGSGKAGVPYEIRQVMPAALTCRYMLTVRAVRTDLYRFSESAYDPDCSSERRGRRTAKEDLR